jgi:hypothetical protein
MESNKSKTGGKTNRSISISGSGNPGTKSKIQTKKMIVYVVGDCGPEHNSIASIHRTYEGALKAWDRLRMDLLCEAKASLKRIRKSKNRDDCMDEIYSRIAKNLRCKDPKKIDNFPHETPYIEERTVEE